MVVAVCGDALTTYSENVELRLLRARALTALRRDEEAQRELRRCLRLDPRSAPCYRLLGELSLRRDELESAEIFLKEALRLDPNERDAKDLLDIARSLLNNAKQPTVAVERLPAATATVGPFPSRQASLERPAEHASGAGRSCRMASGTCHENASPMFGEYLVSIGVLTPTQLETALDYQHSVGIRVGSAAVALGYISQPKVDWAAHAYHSRDKWR